MLNDEMSARPSLASSLDRPMDLGVDHVFVIGGDILEQALGRMRHPIAVLVNLAELHLHDVPHGDDRVLRPWCGVSDNEIGSLKVTPDEIADGSEFSRSPRSLPCATPKSPHPWVALSK